MMKESELSDIEHFYADRMKHFEEERQEITNYIHLIGPEQCELHILHWQERQLLSVTTNFRDKCNEQHSEFDEIKRNLETGITLRSISELHHAKGDIPSAIQQATISVLKLRATVSLRNAQKQSEISSEASSNSVEDVEQLVSSLLLLGSLYHETSETIQGTAIFQEAAKTVVMQQDQQVLHSLPHSSLNALREVTAMLARGYCSPCA